MMPTRQEAAVNSLKPAVLIQACHDYDAERIRMIVREGLDELQLKPYGRTLLKPNVVASGKLFPHAYTRAEFVEGVLKALLDRGEAIEELAVGERCGITMPTRYAFSGADYYSLNKRVPGLVLRHFEEEPQVQIPLYHQGRLRDFLFTPRSVASADFLVNCPKFKAHPWTTVTFSLKNYIGLQDDRHRLIDHDHALNRKVADLQYIAQPQLIAIDAIEAGQGRMLTPLPFDLGLVLLGNNQVAFDSVCCHILGIDPLAVDHIRLAHERGFGPVDLKKITIGGNVSLAEARERAQGFKRGLIRVEDYFQGTNIQAYAGPPPGEDEDYCWGGCPGALEEAIEILRVIDSATDKKMPPLHLVFGRYEGPINASAEEKVIFIGDCAQFRGSIAGNDVEIQSLYVDRNEKDPRHAKSEDIFGKLVRTGANLFVARNKNVIRLKGCPVSVSEQVFALMHLGHLQNPFLVPSIAAPFVSSYLSWRTRALFKRITGQRYHTEGPAFRGQARPLLNLPSPERDGDRSSNTEKKES